MDVRGLQKLTLLDYPGRVACTVFTGGCNLKCPFCHNAALVNRPDECERVPKEELFRFLGRRRGALDGVCISGGEPLLQADIEEFAGRIKDMGFAVKLDTNGCFPDKLARLIDKGLIDYAAMDLKNSPERYGQTAGVPGFDITPVKESIALLMKGGADYEFRTTVVRELHDEESLRQAAELIKGAKRYFLQSFVDSGDLVGTGMSGYGRDEMEALLTVVSPYVEYAALRGI